MFFKTCFSILLLQALFFFPAYGDQTQFSQNLRTTIQGLEQSEEKPMFIVLEKVPTATVAGQNRANRIIIIATDDFFNPEVNTPVSLQNYKLNWEFSWSVAGAYSIPHLLLNFLPLYKYASEVILVSYILAQNYFDFNFELDGPISFIMFPLLRFERWIKMGSHLDRLNHLMVDQEEFAVIATHPTSYILMKHFENNEYSLVYSGNNFHRKFAF